MAFFPHNFFQPAEPSFHPLFRLLDDYESHNRQSNRPCGVRRQQAVFQWQPKFDIREVADAYELHGELPGITKDSVHIEFSDPQTLVVRGRNERSYAAGTSPHAHAQLVEAAAPASPALSSASASASHGPEATTTATEAQKTQERRGSHQATVEDEDEAMERESAYEVVAEGEEAEKKEVEVEKVEEKKKSVDKAKYWLTERSVGSFYRSFNFPTRVEQDSVTASFQDGILSISVPKAKKHESRRIYIA